MFFTGIDMGVDTGMGSEAVVVTVAEKVEAVVEKESALGDDWAEMLPPVVSALYILFVLVILGASTWESASRYGSVCTDHPDLLVSPAPVDVVIPPAVLSPVAP